MAETVGSLIDKISILELKIFYMKAQTERQDSSPEHRATCGQKHAILLQQRDDLAQELSLFLANLSEGKATLKIYRQFKMYNDPSYREQPKSSDKTH